MCHLAARKSSTVYHFENETHLNAYTRKRNNISSSFIVHDCFHSYEYICLKANRQQVIDLSVQIVLSAHFLFEQKRKESNHTLDWWIFYFLKDILKIFSGKEMKNKKKFFLHFKIQEKIQSICYYLQLIVHKRNRLNQVELNHHFYINHFMT